VCGVLAATFLEVLMYTNADTLTNKMIEFELLIKEKNYDVVAVTETLPKILAMTLVTLS
jgi:hypothetical protein